jgi:hypothetical protein
LGLKENKHAIFLRNILPFELKNNRVLPFIMPQKNVKDEN